MSLQLEDRIMRQIGMSNHFTYYNGGGCQEIRQKAVLCLPAAFEKAIKEGEKIAPINAELLDLIAAISIRGDESPYSLTNTWKAIHDFIRIHQYIAAGKNYNPHNDIEIVRERYFPQQETEMCNVYMEVETLDFQMLESLWPHMTKNALEKLVDARS